MYRIAFDVAQSVLPADPVRSDIACFIGFVPMSASASKELPTGLCAWLNNNRWMERVERPGNPSVYDLLDVPVPVDSWEGFQALFAGDQRLDGRIEIHSLSLTENISLAAEHSVLYFSMDRALKEVRLPTGDVSLTDVVEAVNSKKIGITARDVVVSGLKHLVISHDSPGKSGQLTVYANPCLGFPRAINAANSYIDSYLSAAVRSFFAQGGRKCYVVRMGDPLSFDAAEKEKIVQLARLLWGNASQWKTGLKLSDLVWVKLPPLPTPAEPQENWHGISHIFGLPDVSYISLPDLPDLFSSPPRPLDPVQQKTPPEDFVACAPSIAEAPSVGMRRLTAPRCNETGFKGWSRIIQYVNCLLGPTCQEMQLVASLPLPHTDLPGDFGSFIQTTCFGDQPRGESIASGFIQVGFPWLRQSYGIALPEAMEPPEGVLVGLLAENALRKGAYTSAAGAIVRQAYDLMPTEIPGFGVDPAKEEEGEDGSISLFAFTPNGIQLASDVTTSRDALYRHGAVRRLISLIVRAARHYGLASVFEPQTKPTWQAVEKNLSTLLMYIYDAGGLRGKSEEEAFSVTCDRTTMTQNDIDNGRLIANISLWPAVPIERLMVTLMLENNGSMVLRGAA